MRQRTIYTDEFRAEPAENKRLVLPHLGVLQRTKYRDEARYYITMYILEQKRRVSLAS